MASPACWRSQDEAISDTATSSEAFGHPFHVGAERSKDVGMVDIPGGTLRVGYECGSAPRVTPHEPQARSVVLKAYSIDEFPFPNDPSQPVVTGVTRAEAAELCHQRGKRLCTALEWERACKGPRNLVYEWGNNFDRRACRARADGRAMRRRGCRSGFGVYDMHGLVLEWTSTPWARESLQGTVRGSTFEDVTALNGRCVYAEARPPSARAPTVGFRCCSGEPNRGEPRVEREREQALVEEDDVSDELTTRLVAAMPPEYRGREDLEQAIERLWRWHPVPGEELLVARWRGSLPSRNAPFYQLVVFDECPAGMRRVARARGPVEVLGEPTPGPSPDVLDVMMQSPPHGGTMTLRYWYGRVQVLEPAWVGHSVQPAVRVLLPRRSR